MKKLALLIISIFTINAHSQVIPPERQVNWSNTLLSYQFEVPVNEVNVMDFGATGNGTTNDKPATWAVQSVGQIVQIDHRHNNTLFLMSPLRITYEVILNPRVRKIDPRVNAGVECLKIKRIDQSSSGANILLSLAANCHIRGLESDKSVSAHVDIFQSTRILIEGCYFHHTFLCDCASKHGYGVILNSHSSCKIQVGQPGFRIDHLPIDKGLDRLGKYKLG